MRGFENMTVEDLKKMGFKVSENCVKNKLDIQGDKLLDEKKKSKYNANRVEIDGIKFDSQKERRLLLRIEIKVSCRRYKRFLQTA